MTRRTPSIPHFIPFWQMTPQEKREHLIRMHSVHPALLVFPGPSRDRKYHDDGIGVVPHDHAKPLRSHTPDP